MRIRKPSAEKKSCECGCGTLISVRGADSRTRRFVIGHNTRVGLGWKNPHRFKKAERMVHG